MLCRGNVDLNRDFPDPLLLGTSGLQPTGGEQPETLALMKWMSGTHFVASVSLHEVSQQFILACSALQWCVFCVAVAPVIATKSNVFMKVSKI